MVIDIAGERAGLTGKAAPGRDCARTTAPPEGIHLDSRGAGCRALSQCTHRPSRPSTRLIMSAAPRAARCRPPAPSPAARCPSPRPQAGGWARRIGEGAPSRARASSAARAPAARRGHRAPPRPRTGVTAAQEHGGRFARPDAWPSGSSARCPSPRPPAGGWATRAARRRWPDQAFIRREGARRAMR